MTRDLFLEKSYFNKTKDFFDDNLEVRVFKKVATDSNYNISIKLEYSPDCYIYSYVINCLGDEGYLSLIEDLRHSLRLLGNGVSSTGSLIDQSKSKYFHINGKERDFSLSDLLKITENLSSF